MTAFILIESVALSTDCNQFSLATRNLPFSDLSMPTRGGGRQGWLLVLLLAPHLTCQIDPANPQTPSVQKKKYRLTIY